MQPSVRGNTGTCTELRAQPCSNFVSPPGGGSCQGVNNLKIPGCRPFGGDWRRCRASKLHGQGLPAPKAATSMLQMSLKGGFVSKQETHASEEATGTSEVELS